MRMLIFPLVLGLFIAAIIPTLAQPDPQQVRWIVPGRFLMAEMLYQPISVSSPQGLFILQKGVLGKFDPRTLKPLGMVEVLGPLPAVPEFGFADNNQAWQFTLERAKRLLPATLLAQDNDLLLQCGDQYIRVDPVKLEIRASASVIKQDNPLQRIDPLIVSRQPETLVLDGAVGYRVSSTSWGDQTAIMTAVNLDDGAVLASKPLPPEMMNRPGWVRKNDDGADVAPVIYQLMQAPPTAWRLTQQGLFVLRLGILAKFDPKTLQFLGSVPLFGPLPDVKDLAESTLEERKAVNIERARRYLPCAVFPAGKSLLVLVGDRFFRVDPITLDIKAQAVLAPVEGEEQLKRMTGLATLGLPPTAVAGNTLVTISGSRPLLVDGDTGASTPLTLPESFSRPLPYSITHVGGVPSFRDQEVTDDQQVTVQGMLEKHTGADGDFWSILDEQRGEFVLTGMKLQELLARPGVLTGSVTITGVFKKERAGIPQYGKGSVEIREMYAFVGHFPVTQGTLIRHAGTQGDTWTLKTPRGTEFVLTGEKVKELTASADIEKRQVFVIGALKPEYPIGVTIRGRGCLEVTMFQVYPTRVEMERSQDDARPYSLAVTPQSCYLSRNGLVTRIDLRTAEVKAVHELLPPLPAVPEGGFADNKDTERFNSERALRMQPTALVVQEKQVLALLAGRLFILDAATLDNRAMVPLTDETTQAPGKITVQGTTACLNYGTKFFAVDLDAGKLSATMTLPEKMQPNIFPDLGEQFKAQGK